MVRDAYPILVPIAGLTVICLLLGWFFPPLLIAAALCALLTSFVAFFFRDPVRVVPADERLIVSPADGKVVVVRPEGDRGEMLVGIFLSVFDVHINRSPITGTVTEVRYQRGRFMIASNHRASVENEQNLVVVENHAVRIVFKQIAGLIARRIVFWKKVGCLVVKGERVGLIKFGSRVDVILPPNVAVLVKKGDRVKGGLSIIGEVKL